MFAHGKTQTFIESLNKIRIKDIAQLAGVSAGTVDRVIHDRGQVSEENRLKIQKIIDDLKYKPNLLARSLASKRSYKIVALIPESRNSKGFWEAPVRGVLKAWKEIADYNATVVNLCFDQFKVSTFKNKTKELLDLKPDAVLIAPVFKQETTELANLLDDQKISYVFIDSNIEGLNNLAYFGQNSYQSGFLAARLLVMGLPEKASVAVIKPSGSNISNQILSRESGFKAFFNDNDLNSYNFVSVEYELENELEREKQLQLFFINNPEVAAAIVFNSRVNDIARFIEKFNTRKIRLIGYDLLKENVEYLRKGVVTFLIAQRPEEQGYRSIITLFNYLAFKQEVAKVQYVPIDILTSENIDYYINFNR